MPDDPHAHHQQHTLLPEVRYIFEVPDQKPDVHVHRVKLTESLSKPYELEIELISEDYEFDPEDLLGSDCTLTIARDGHPARQLMGIILRVQQRGRPDQRQSLKLDIGPALALFAHELDTRAWQHLSVPEIVLDVLEDRLGALGRRLRLDLDLAAYPPREYCAQYRESHLDFVLRLLHDEGIAFRFDHDSHADSETLVLFDTNDRCPARSPVGFDRRHTVLSAEEAIDRLERVRKLGPTGVTQRDWAPLTTGDAPFFLHTRCARDDRHRERIVYDHDDRRIEVDDDGLRARRKLDRLTAERDACHGDSDLVEFTPGLRFELTGHPESARDRSYLLLRVTHQGAVADADPLGDDVSDDTPRYRNTFDCIPDDVPFRPQPTAPRPRVHGPHTALVVGPDGEEIHTDEHGRIKVRFHWDRDSPADDRASCWVRVAQTWAGAGWGALFIPRVGMEVLVEFIDGDPDRPLVVGCVYNARNTPPVALPDDKTCSALTSESSPGGGLANQIRLEDGRGRESLTLKTRRDLHTTAGHDHTVTVAHDQTTKIGENQTNTIDGKQTTTVKGHREIKVSEGNLTTTVNAGTQTTTIHGDTTCTVKAGQSQLNVEQGGHSLTAKRKIALQSTTEDISVIGKTSLALKAETNQIGIESHYESKITSHASSVQVKGETFLRFEAIREHICLDAKTDVAVDARTGGLSLKAAQLLSIHTDDSAHVEGKAIMITATDTLTLCVGTSSIVISPTSIEIRAPLITSAAVGEHLISGALIRLN